MPEPDTDKNKKAEENAVPAENPASEQKPDAGHRTSRGAKWAIILLSVLCVILLGALLEVAFLPQLIERDVNSLLRKMAGDGMEFRIKTISLTSAEVACKIKDTTRDGRPLKVGSIGSFSIRYSPLPLLLERAIESIDIENCDVMADYSDGTVSIPAYDIIAKSFLSGEKKEKDDMTAPVDDLNAVVPVRIGRISLSGTLAAVARDEDTVDTLHIPYSVTVRPDAELGWNKLECSLMVHFATNGIRGKATYTHKEKKVALDLDDFTFATSGLPRAVRTGLPRGLRAGIALGAKAEIDLNSLTVEELDNSSLDLSGELSLGYRTQQGLRIDSTAPFTLKTIPRVIPTVKPMNPPKTEKDIVFTLGSLKGEYDAIPFELGGFEAAVSLRRQTVRGCFRFTVADSEAAEFSFGGGLDGEEMSFRLALANKPLLRAAYMGADVSFRPDKLTAELNRTGDGLIHATASFSLLEPIAGIDGGALNPELKGMTATLKPETISGGFRMAGDRMDASLDVSGGEVSAKYKGADVFFRPDKLTAKLEKTGDGIDATASFSLLEPIAGIDGGALNPELKGMTATLKPETITGEFRMEGSRMNVSLGISGGKYHAGYKGMEGDFRPQKIAASFRTEDGRNVISAGFTNGEIEFKKEGMDVSFKPESFQAGITLADGIKEASAELKGGALAAELEGMSCGVETVSFNAESKDGQNYKADAKITAFQFKQNAAGLTYEAPELGLNAAFDGAVLSGEFVCGDSKLTMPELKLLAQNLHWEFPFDYSLAKPAADDAENTENETVSAAPRTGKVSLGDFEVNGVQAASLDGTIQWDDPAKTLHLKTDAKLLSIDGHIYADVALGDAGVETVCGLDIPEQDADLSKDLAKFLPQFEEISCTGKLEGHAVYKLLPKTTTGNAKFRIADADVFVPEKKLEVRGINLGFEIPEIAVMKSAPGQSLSFKSVKYDRIETGAGRATFRMEAPDTWQVENALLDWCGGHIRLGSVTYRPGQTTTEAVLYCDRLELPLFLTQIGLGQISGSGSINGTIPIVIVQKTDAFGKTKIDNIYFEDAFLFSTPGEDGVIKGELDESLTNAESGIEMDLSKEALKDFTYSWVRMRMISSGPEKENLKLELQLDGRPNRSLYYSFDEKTASFIKSPTPCIFQGIRLNTNVNMYGKAMELVDYFQQISSKIKGQ